MGETDLRLRTPWKRGAASGCSGPFLVSYTEITWSTALDIPRIYFAAERLRREGARLEGAVGLTLYWHPLRGRGGSLSVWTDEKALRRFVALPFHLEIIRRFRDRASVRAIDWRTDSFSLREAFILGQRALDDGQQG